MKDLVIIGAGGFAREVAWLVEEINNHNEEWNIIGFFDENNHGVTDINGYPVIAKEQFDNFKSSYIIIAIGDSESRKIVAEKYGKDYRLATLIHPEISISKTNYIGEGSIICKGTILTVNISIGKSVIINLDCTIGHDAKINDYSTLLPSVNISGGVEIGECANIGTGSQIIQYKKIGNNSIIGAGSVVVKDIDSYVVAVGIPAKEIKSRKV